MAHHFRNEDARRVGLSSGDEANAREAAGEESGGRGGRAPSELLEVWCRLGGAGAGAVLRRSAGVDGAGRLAVVQRWSAEEDERVEAATWVRAAVKAAGAFWDRDGASGPRPLRNRIVPLTVAEGTDEHATRHVVVLPMSPASALGAEGNGQGVREAAAFLLHMADPRAAADALRRLELAGVLLTEMALLQARLFERERVTRRISSSVETLSAAGEHERFIASAQAVCEALAGKLDAQRVALGVRRGRYVRLMAVTGIEKIDRKTEASQRVEAAMEECLDQDVEVQHPAPPEATYVHRQAGELAREQKAAVCLFPIRRTQSKGEVEAVLLVERGERGEGRLLTVEEAAATRLALDLAGPRLLEQAGRDRWVGARLAHATHRGLATLVGPEHTWAKALALVVLTLAVLSVAVPVPVRVEAPFVVEARERRTVPAPFAGRLESVARGVEPGTTVRAGQELARLETRELREREAKLLAQASAYWAEARKAQAAAARGEVEPRVEADIANARAREAEAELQTIRRELSEAVVRSPVDGVILTGDLRQRVRGPLERGETLFEVAPLERVRATLYVDDGRIGEVRPRQRGHLATQAHPSRYLPFEVERVYPAAEVTAGRNAFRVRARLLPLEGEASPPPLPVGAEGLAKVRTDRAPVIVAWTRDAVDWVRMKLWI